MQCNEFQSLIMPFIHKKLSVHKKEELITHLMTCSKCAEELEIYYIIVNCIKGLDEDIDFPDDFHREYLGFLKETEREIKSHKNRTFRQKTAFSAVLALSVILTGVSFRTVAEEPNEKQMRTGDISESDLNMRFRFKNEHIYYSSPLKVERLKYLIHKKGR